MSFNATVAAAATSSVTSRCARPRGPVALPLAPEAASSSASCSSRNARSRLSRVINAGRRSVSRSRDAVGMTSTPVMVISRVGGIDQRRSRAAIGASSGIRCEGREITDPE